MRRKQKKKQHDNNRAILSIAYYNVHYMDQPESWKMHLVLGVSTVLGVIKVVSAFDLFYRGVRDIYDATELGWGAFVWGFPWCGSSSMTA